MSSVLFNLICAGISLGMGLLSLFFRRKTIARLRQLVGSWENMYQVEHRERLDAMEQLHRYARAFPQGPDAVQADGDLRILVTHGSQEIYTVEERAATGPWHWVDGSSAPVTYEAASIIATRRARVGRPVRVCRQDHPGFPVYEVNPMHVDAPGPQPSVPQWTQLMAVRPNECLELDPRQEQQRALREGMIDRWLRNKFEGQPIEIIIPQNIKGRVLRVLLLHYQQAGWTVEERRNNMRQRIWRFSQKPDGPTPVIGSERARVIDLTPHPIPPETVSAQNQGTGADRQTA